MENLERLLREHDFLQGMTEEQTATIVSCAKNLRFGPGSFLMREGDDADTFYLLRIGRVVLEADIPGQGLVTMETVGPGDLLGLSWLFPPHRVQLGAVAAETVVALVVHGACVRGKMEADPALGYALTRRLLAETYSRLQRVRLQRLDVYKGI